MVVRTLLGGPGRLFKECSCGIHAGGMCLCILHLCLTCLAAATAAESSGSSLVEGVVTNGIAVGGYWSLRHVVSGVERRKAGKAT